MSSTKRSKRHRQQRNKISTRDRYISATNFRNYAQGVNSEYKKRFKKESVLYAPGIKPFKTYSDFQ